jgi:hypothetical protein
MSWPPSPRRKTSHQQYRCERMRNADPESLVSSDGRRRARARIRRARAAGSRARGSPRRTHGWPRPGEYECHIRPHLRRARAVHVRETLRRESGEELGARGTRARQAPIAPASRRSRGPWSRPVCARPPSSGEPRVRTRSHTPCPAHGLRPPRVTDARGAPARHRGPAPRQERSWLTSECTEVQGGRLGHRRVRRRTRPDHDIYPGRGRRVTSGARWRRSARRGRQDDGIAPRPRRAPARR